MKLRYSATSPYVRKVRVALAYKGIEYDNTQPVPFGAPPEFVKKSPLSRIPCWEEGVDVDFKLHAPKQTTVEVSYRDGEIKKLIVVPASREKDVVVRMKR